MAALNICMASITTSTLQQYNVGLRLWWQFCKDRDLNVFTITVPLLLDFLTIHFNKGASYSTLNAYRSAIAQITGPEMGHQVSVKRFFKGIYNLRPSLPRYTSTWDPFIVLDYIKKLPSTEKLPLDVLTYKLAGLVALASGQRVQTLSLIEINNIEEREEGIIIKIPKRVKTSSKNSVQPTMDFPFYEEDPRVCVARTMQIYLKRTEKLRKESAENLFLTFKKPHHNASSQTISRWIKNLLKKSGLDTTIFTAHSTRHASTSAAARQGVSVDTIRLAAGWRKNSETFARFYQRPILHKRDFAHAVLNS